MLTDVVVCSSRLQKVECFCYLGRNRSMILKDTAPPSKESLEEPAMTKIDRRIHLLKP
jgi:hypothetical protein